MTLVPQEKTLTKLWCDSLNKILSLMKTTILFHPLPNSFTLGSHLSWRFGSVTETSHVPGVPPCYVFCECEHVNTYRIRTHSLILTARFSRISIATVTFCAVVLITGDADAFVATHGAVPLTNALFYNISSQSVITEKLRIPSLKGKFLFDILVCRIPKLKFLDIRRNHLSKCRKKLRHILCLLNLSTKI